jgi:hypothetical protein
MINWALAILMAKSLFLLIWANVKLFDYSLVDRQHRSGYAMFEMAALRQNIGW